MGSPRSDKTIAKRVVVVLSGSVDAGESVNSEKGTIKAGFADRADSDKKDIQGYIHIDNSFHDSYGVEIDSQ